MYRKVLIAIPCGDKVENECIESIYNQQFSSNVYTKLKIIRGYNIDNSRNKGVEIAINGDYTHLFFVDSDQIINEFTLQNLINANVDIATTWTKRRGANTKSNLFFNNEGSYDDKHNYEVADIENMRKHATSLKVTGVGMSGILIKVDVFKDIMEKILDTQVYRSIWYPDGTGLSEDLAFCSIAREHGYEIIAILNERIAHIDKVIL